MKSTLAIILFLILFIQLQQIRGGPVAGTACCAACCAPTLAATPLVSGLCLATCTASMGTVPSYCIFCMPAFLSPIP
ncbi:unnamed protein product [Rotaria sp. Silwood2]|nr:unnamed protein product [Rotaria sp. Silwood2]CAF3115137.1 unnamed protein product [Rotaria sp. Silwood2]CAF3365863.1 unnamed protein product [Rotaria sp. Silwood2]CAF3428563.1 unnamed protein product [Rotaria sp. Silwood2]CAF4320763.1 unnamed protein product [Rotaria sp. Silwood2]